MLESQAVCVDRLTYHLILKQLPCLLDCRVVYRVEMEERVRSQG